MCVLCGEPLAHVHWADRGEVQRDTGVALAGSDDEGERRRARLRRRTVLRAVLAAYGLRVDDWNGRRLVVSNGKGATALARDLGELWPLVTRLAGRSADPLDPALLATLG